MNWFGGGVPVSKVEHVWGGPGQGRRVGVMSLNGEVQCVMGNSHMGNLSPEQNDRQTPVKILPSRNFLGVL